MDSAGSHETVLVIDFGGQYTQLIARKIRELGVYAAIVPWDSEHLAESYEFAKAIVLSGGPKSVLDEGSPMIDTTLLRSGKPVLGICYGLQLMAYLLDGKVEKSESREYGKQSFVPTHENRLLKSESQVWMSHGDSVIQLPNGFECCGSTENCKVAAFQNINDRLFGVQFHPEVTHTTEGKHILRNFLFDVSGFSGDWRPKNLAAELVLKIQHQVGDSKVLCGVSGGVDSTVAAALIAKAIGHQLVCVFVDHGLMRKDESKQVIETFRKHIDAELVPIDASKQFFEALRGVTDPEEKRKIIGSEFVKVFESHAKEWSDCKFLAQGTLYPDVVESGSKTAAKIKTHHNVGGLPEWMKMELVEPLRWLFKDEVRAIGRELGLPSEMIEREPFPGPGLGVRIIGEVTPERVRIVQEADAIFREELQQSGVKQIIWQSYAALLDTLSVGVMGDERTYQHPIVLRAVASEDAMTANAVAIPWKVLETVATRIVNEVKGVNRVFYDLTSKPPATIELE